MQNNKDLRTRFAFVEESATMPKGMLLLLLDGVPLPDGIKVRWCSDEEDAAFKEAANQYE